MAYLIADFIKLRVGGTGIPCVFEYLSIEQLNIKSIIGNVLFSQRTVNYIVDDYYDQMVGQRAIPG